MQILTFANRGYAHTGDWVGTEDIKLADFAHLDGAWNHSKTLIHKLRGFFTAEEMPSEILTLAVAGSLGRMEASGVSDCDLVIVLKEPNTANPADVYARIWEILAPESITPPKPNGTFSRPTSTQELCDSTNVGGPGEDLGMLARRQLLLLETQPVYNDTGYETLIEDVLTFYAEKYVRTDPRKEWVFLINDLVRYFRALCVNYQWDFNNEHGKWRLRNVKLRHSRLIMYAGLLFLLGECSKERGDKYGWLRARLKLTPLERIAWVYRENCDTNFFRIAGFYNTFLGLLAQDRVRKELGSAEEDSYKTRYDMPHYAMLKANSDGLVAELLRFVLERRGSWTERFFEYLIF